MRRWLATLLLVLLPLQFSWAAVAGYCAHETGAAAEHLGHHDHAGHGHAAPQGDSVPAGPDAADGGTTASSDTDCSHCLGSCTGLPDVATAFVPPLPGSAVPLATAARSAEYLPAQPERPQWAALA